MAHFAPNFVDIATGVTVKLADPENHTIGLKITTLSYT